jgi:hypothetical protein
MIKKAQGLCLNCAHSPDCALMLTKKALQGIQFCEEYETVHLAAAVPLSGNPSKGLIQRTPPGIPGLCSNCDQYPVCSFPKPEAGVWHCEEYR